MANRLKRIRQFRGLTQKELGMCLKFPEHTADIRISQYESGKRKPKSRNLKKLAKVLRVAPEALTVPHLNSLNDVIQMLFEFEEQYGLTFKLADAEQKARESHKELDAFMSEWKVKKDQLKSGYITPYQYDHWRFNYTINDNK